MAKYATVRQSAGVVPVGDKNGRAAGQDVAPSTRGTEQRWIATLLYQRDSAGDRGGVGNVLAGEGQSLGEESGQAQIYGAPLYRGELAKKKKVRCEEETTTARESAPRYSR